MTTRKEILNHAALCVCQDREAQYGSPENSFGLIARLWREYLDTDNAITPHDVAMMMALLKIARIVTGRFKADSYVDACGYLACAGELAANTNDE